jgi:hypothetical protein
MRAESGNTALTGEAPLPPVEHREPDEPAPTEPGAAPAKPAPRRRPKKK